MSVGQINNSKLMWKISGGLSALLIITGAWMYLQTSNNQVDSNQIAHHTQTKALNVEPAVVVKALAETTIKDENALVKASILEQDVPQNASLAKEEIAKLEDIQDQLRTQLNMLAEQEKNADKIIQLKEEQLKLLEAQLSVQN